MAVNNRRPASNVTAKFLKAKKSIAPDGTAHLVDKASQA
jgi:hypothetical protein